MEEDSELVMTFPAPYGVFSPDEKLLNCTNASFAWPGEGWFDDDDIHIR